MVLRFLYAIVFLVPAIPAESQMTAPIQISFNPKKTYQTIRNFAASDAWSAQFVGLWPEEKKNTMADWLFSMDTLPNGNPKGIGLSMWRFNIGAGSAEQGRESGIRDPWRRAAELTSDSPRAVAQKWFIKAAKERGVQQFLGFFNSPPVRLTRNGKAFAVGGKSNIDSSNYRSFAQYAWDAIRNVEQSAGIAVNFISPVNEPQWDWSDGGQEGNPYNNTEMAGIVRSFDSLFQEKKLATKILVTESGSYKYLLRHDDKPGRGDQIHDFFRPTSVNYIGNLPSVAKTIAGHSYFTTSPYPQAIALRNNIRNRIDSIPNLELWQSEYCILGDNAGEINGNKKDLGMDAALYLAKVIHADLVEANAAAWQWWTAISAYNYKDGLIYIDKNATDGNFSDSKMLWALGNYSRFIRPGMKRIAVDSVANQDIKVAAFSKGPKKETVLVIINTSDVAKEIVFANGKQKGFKNIRAYITDSSNNLSPINLQSGLFAIPPNSIVTLVVK